MSSATETIKDRLGVVEVIGSYIKLEKAGGNFKACCPFHNEKTPSFFISPGRASYYCFGCGAKGDIFTFVQEFEKVDFIGALKILAEKAGVELEQFKDENKGELDKLRGVLDVATTFYQTELKRNTEALKYLSGRGLNEKTIADWRIGFAPNEWRRAHDFLMTKNVREDDMEKVGLIKKSEKSDSASASTGAGQQGQSSGRVTVYDRFRARVMFPMFDPSSRVIGYSGRIFGVPDSEGPKYLNSPDTVLFNKSETLYGFNKAKDGIRQWGYAILVEGQMDLLMCHQAGYTNAVATSGTALTSLHLEKLKKMSDNLILVYDADKAGIKATLRAWTSALALGMNVKVAGLPNGEDPASILQKDKEKFKESLKNSKHIIDYYIDILSKESMSKDNFKKSIQTEVLPYIAVIDSAIERSNYISRVSVSTNIYETDLREEVEKLRASGVSNILNKARIEAQESLVRNSAKLNTSVGKSISPSAIKSGAYATERRILSLILWLQNSEKKDGKPGEKEENSKKAENLLNSLKSILQDEEFVKIESSLSELKNSDPGLLFEAEMLFEGSDRVDKEAEELIQSLEEITLKERLSKAMSELQIAEKKGDKESSEKLVKECQEISLKLSELNSKRKN